MRVYIYNFIYLYLIDKTTKLPIIADQPLKNKRSN